MAVLFSFMVYRRPRESTPASRICCVQKSRAGPARYLPTDFMTDSFVMVGSFSLMMCFFSRFTLFTCLFTRLRNCTFRGVSAVTAGVQSVMARAWMAIIPYCQQMSVFV